MEKKTAWGGMCVGGLMGYDRDDYIGNLMLPKVWATPQSELTILPKAKAKRSSAWWITLGK